MASQLADLIRKKYPGQYDDMDDATLEKSVLAKYPQYKDLANPAFQASSQPPESSADSILADAKKPLTTIPSQPDASSDTTQQPQATAAEEPSLLEKLYHGVFEAPSFITDAAHKLANAATTPKLEDTPFSAKLKGFEAGATEGAASLLSPANLLGLAGGRLGEIAARTIGSAQAAHGASELYKGNYGRGLAEIAMGGLGIAGPHGEAPEVSSGVPEADIPIQASSNLSNIADSIKAPVTEQPRPTGPWDGNFDANPAKPVVKSTDDQIYDIARNKFNMGKDLPSDDFDPDSLVGLKLSKTDKTNEPTAEFLGLQQDGSPLFNVKGGPSDQSTVGLDKLKELGIKTPEIPADAKPVKGDELRALAMKNRSDAMDARNPGFKGTEEAPDESLNGSPDRSLLSDERGKVGVNINDDGTNSSSPTKPRYKLDLETGAGIPINEKGEQIGPAQFSGKELNPELAALSKYSKSASMANESQKKSLWGETRDAQRAILTSFDFSAAGRQGKPLLLTKAYWNSFDDMFKAWGSERAYKNVMDSIYEHPNFKSQVSPLTGKATQSLADRAGLNIGSAEQFQSNIAEKYVPLVRRSERAYNAFLNKLRADHFNSMVKDSVAAGVDVTKNNTELKKLGSFINDATGRGSLGKLEKAAPILNEVFFAPRLMASRVNMYKRWLNPMTYADTNPVIRKQALKSLIATVGFGTSVGELARLGGATVNNDPNSSDFRKAKIGNTRIDPFSGFQQYAVGASRLISGEMTSSSSGRTFDLSNPKYGGPSRASVTGQFLQNKLAPVPSMVLSWMQGKDWDGKPFTLKNALMQRTVPIVMQDLMDLYKEDPTRFPAGVFKNNPTATKIGAGLGSVMGEGIQTYGR